MRSTKIAPDSLSTSYLTGSASLGISMMTLISSGGFLPVLTWSRPMGVTAPVAPGRARPVGESRPFYAARAGSAGTPPVRCRGAGVYPRVGQAPVGPLHAEAYPWQTQPENTHLTAMS